MAKKTWRLSASFIASFKACPYRCYLKYVQGIIPAEDTDALRMGTNWHKLLEIMGMKIDDPMNAVIRHLNEAYETVPMSKTRQEWLTERAVLLYSCAGYNWYYSDDPFEVIAEEVYFKLPVRNPDTGRALPNVILTGKIDKIVKAPNGHYYIDEHKSTSSSLDPDSTYWKHLTLDTQTRLYPYAAQQMQLAGELEKYGIKATDPLISTVRYDAWHKPQIRPKKLTQGDSKKFIEAGEYMGDTFEVNGNPEADIVLVNGEQAKIEPGAKEGIFTIRETPDMFGARLLKDISERPEYYFCRKEIVRTQKDLEDFQREIFNIYHTVKFMDRNKTWWQNEQQCEAIYRCQNIDICYNGIDVTSGTVPEGFKLTDWKEKENEKSS